MNKCLRIKNKFEVWMPNNTHFNLLYSRIYYWSRNVYFL